MKRLNEETQDNTNTDGEQPQEKPVEKKSTIKKIAAGTGKILAASAMVVKESAVSIKSIYASQKADIEKSVKWAPKMYTGALSLVYAVLNAPEDAITKSLGSIAGWGFRWAYGSIVKPLKAVVAALDVRTWINFVSTIWSFVMECIPKSIFSMVTRFFEALSEYWYSFTKAIAGTKRIQSMVQKKMLMESKAELMEGKIWDWLKNKVYAVASKFKDAAWWLLKKGLGLVEKAFLIVIQPLAECMTRVNKLGGASKVMSVFGSKDAAKSAATSWIATSLGLSGAIAGAATLGPIAALMGVVGTVAWVFSLTTYMNMVGQFLEFKNMIVDVFAD